MELFQILKASGVPTEALSAIVSLKNFWLVCRNCADTFSEDHGQTPAFDAPFAESDKTRLSENWHRNHSYVTPS